MLWIIIAAAFLLGNLFVIALAAAASRGDDDNELVFQERERAINQIELYANHLNVV